MNIKQFALNMLPYWILSIFVILTVLKTDQKKLLKIDKNQVFKWIRFLLLVTVIRIILCKLYSSQYILNSIKKISDLPWQVGLTVFWEDAVHGMPLVIFQKLIKNVKFNKILYKIALILTMIEFGIGHLYQGFIPAFLLSFYIPFSIGIAKKHGFGTVMICHMLFDISSLLFVKYLITFY